MGGHLCALNTFIGPFALMCQLAYHCALSHCIMDMIHPEGSQIGFKAWQYHIIVITFGTTFAFVSTFVLEDSGISILGLCGTA